ncbi:MAG: hypothetical protein KKH94_06180 [Candidatus Omnitrophica bacterium]|nr:hypothetical protein [Candidatus Omnitrophota bacterium]
MSRETLTVEIARYPFSIHTEDSSIFSVLEDSFSGFLSSKHARFMIDVVNRPSSSRIDIGDMPYDVTIGQQNGRFLFYTESSPSIMLGFFDFKKGEATFINQHAELSDHYLVPFLRVVYQLFLFMEGSGLLVHACGIVKDDEGYLFMGPSGCGKTTIAGLSPGGTILSDEFICIRKDHEQYGMYPTPWKADAIGEGYRLKKIIFPKRGESLTVRRLRPALAVNEIIPNIIYAFYNQDIFGKILDFLVQMTETVPCYVMHFSLTSRFWEEVTSDS